MTIKTPTHRFTGFFIPSEILVLSNISPMEILLLGYIDAFFDEEKGGCWASNEYFAEKLHSKANTIAKSLVTLRNLGLVETVSFDGRERVMRSLVGRHVDSKHSKKAKKAKKASEKSNAAIPIFSEKFSENNSEKPSEKPKKAVNQSNAASTKKQVAAIEKSTVSQCESDQKHGVKKSFALDSLELNKRFGLDKNPTLDWRKIHRDDENFPREIEAPPITHDILIDINNPPPTSSVFSNESASDSETLRPSGLLADGGFFNQLNFSDDRKQQIRNEFSSAEIEAASRKIEARKNLTSKEGAFIDALKNPEKWTLTVDKKKIEIEKEIASVQAGLRASAEKRRQEIISQKALAIENADNDKKREWAKQFLTSQGFIQLSKKVYSLSTSYGVQNIEIGHNGIEIITNDRCNKYIFFNKQDFHQTARETIENLGIHESCQK